MISIPQAIRTRLAERTRSVPIHEILVWMQTPQVAIARVSFHQCGRMIEINVRVRVSGSSLPDEIADASNEVIREYYRIERMLRRGVIFM